MRGRYFRTFHLPRWGHFQDGGVRANNPLKVARRESAMIWPTAERPEIIVSVGTGYQSPSPPEDRPSRGILKDGFIPRLFRSQLLCAPALDGEQAWQEAWDEFPPELRQDSFRLNSHLPQGLPELDDAGRIHELNERQYAVPPGLIRGLLATCFYFELDHMPEEASGRVYCRGSILCAAADAYRLVDKALVEFPGAQFVTTAGTLLGPVADDDGCRACGYYRKQVSFAAASLHETITLVIRGQSTEHHLAGFPNNIQWFLDRQNVSAVFGHADHRARSWPLARTCLCTTGRKRRVCFVESNSPVKRARL